MHIVTAADGRMADMLDLTLAQNRKAGFEPHIYDIGGTLGKGTLFTIPEQYSDPRFGISHERKFGKVPYKPDIITRDLMDSDDGCVAWLDADAFAVRPFDRPEGDWDACVTLRRRGESQVRWALHYGFINAGVMFFQRTQQAFEVLEKWRLLIPQTESKSDQEAMNLLLLYAGGMEHGQTLDVEGANVKILTTDEYNWYYWPEPVPETAKIVHMKTDRRAAAMEWLKTR